MQNTNQRDPDNKKMKIDYFPSKILSFKLTNENS